MFGAWYTLDSLRVDGDASADPADYADLTDDQPVGIALYGFARVHLAPDLAPPGYAPQPRPGAPRLPMSWPQQNAILLALRPTKIDLEQWASVERFALVCGRIQVLDIRSPSMGSPSRRPLSVGSRGLPDVELPPLDAQSRKGLVEYQIQHGADKKWANPQVLRQEVYNEIAAYRWDAAVDRVLLTFDKSPTTGRLWTSGQKKEMENDAKRNEDRAYWEHAEYTGPVSRQEGDAMWAFTEPDLDWIEEHVEEILSARKQHQKLQAKHGLELPLVQHPRQAPHQAPFDLETELGLTPQQLVAQRPRQKPPAKRKKGTGRPVFDLEAEIQKLGKFSG
jgi:hypothetical protein